MPRASSLYNQPHQHPFHIPCTDRFARLQRKSLARELVHYHKAFHRTAVNKTIVNDVVRPYVVRTLRPALAATVGRCPFCTLPGGPTRNPDALRLADPVNTLAVHMPPLFPEVNREHPVTIARIRPNKLVDPLQQTSLVIANAGLVSLSRAMLACNLA